MFQIFDEIRTKMLNSQKYSKKGPEIDKLYHALRNETLLVLRAD
jgi:hypothetical protein